MDHDNDWIRRMTRELNRWADESAHNIFGEPAFGESLWIPRVDVFETPDAVIVKICAAGVRRENIDITLSAEGRQLIIRGYREDDTDERAQAVKYHQLEIYTGPFERTISLPGDVRFDRDNLAATARDGFFCVRLPKVLEDSSDSRTVPISAE